VGGCISALIECYCTEHPGLIGQLCVCAVRRVEKRGLIEIAPGSWKEKFYNLQKWEPINRT
jgi:hypothetical protein